MALSHSINAAAGQDIPGQPFRLTKAEGIVDYSEDALARDPSLIVGHPYPPGEDFFYVDDTKQIQAGQLILISTEAENDPETIRAELGQLYFARIQLKAFPEGSPGYQHWKDEETRLQESTMTFYQGRKRIKIDRVVTFVDKVKGLIVVNESFKFGLKPRVMGSVVRVLGFEQMAIDEIRTDQLHREAKKVYGSYDYQAEFDATGKFPALK